MSNGVSKIENDVQDKSSVAWKKLCEYVDKVTTENRDEFSPLEELGQELFSQIHTLPETISKLKRVKKIWMYGSKLKCIPPEIGEMEALEYLDTYTSYDLHWYPFEVTNCKNLKDSRVSTRTLYGNYKNRMGFPQLTYNPVKYLRETVKCSVCKKETSYAETNQLWISLRVGTDVLPLLTNLCSKECERKLPQPPKGYVQYAHKGGADLIQPTYEEWEETKVVNLSMDEIEKLKQKNENKKPKLLRLIRKIWEK